VNIIVSCSLYKRKVRLKYQQLWYASSSSFPLSSEFWKNDTKKSSCSSFIFHV